VAVRPRTLLVAISPVLVGATLGFERTGAIDLGGGAAGAGRGAADAGHHQHAERRRLHRARRRSSGTRTGLPRATANGWLSVRHVRNWASSGVALVATGAGLALVAYRGWPVLAIGVASLLAALAYMGGPEAHRLHALRRADGVRLLRPGGGHRHRLGADRQRRRPTTVLASVAIGSLAAAALAVNNHRDIAHDRWSAGAPSP
jgi:1,4-dihydroxy-2-naphthoate octaprenyltransferase